MITTHNIDIAKDYTTTLGCRYIDDGLYSGEDFRLKFLQPIVDTAVTTKIKITIIIDLDGSYGYPITWLDGAFGLLVENNKLLFDYINIVFISEDDSELPNKIHKLMGVNNE